MKVIDSNTFNTELTFSGVLPSLPPLDKTGTPSYNQTDLVTRLQGSYDYFNNLYLGPDGLPPDEGAQDGNANAFFPAGPDGTYNTYWDGKRLAAYGEMIKIANELGYTYIKEGLIARMKDKMEDYLDGVGPTVIYYDDQWDSLIGYPAGFGTEKSLNDAHFTWGYFISAAATIARYDDSNWADNSQWGGMINLLIENVANADRANGQFPFLRNFDPYAGHSWASGPAMFDNGNNEESTSEAINFATGLILWGTETGQNDIRDLGIYLYTHETTTAQQYWFDVDNDIHPPSLAQPYTTMLWGAGAHYDAWWPATLEELHGINFLPLNGGSLYLGHYPQALADNIQYMHAYIADPNRLNPFEASGLYPELTQSEQIRWFEVTMTALALADGDAALTELNQHLADPASGYPGNYPGDYSNQEFGASEAHTYYWVHTFAILGNPLDTITANIPTYAVFSKNGLKTYTAYNPGSTTTTVCFSDGATLSVPAGQVAYGNGNGPTCPTQNQTPTPTSTGNPATSTPTNPVTSTPTSISASPTPTNTATPTTNPIGYTHGLTTNSSTQGTLWFDPTWNSGWADIHYRINNGGQQNFAMTQANNRWEKVINNLQTGDVIDYFFTYEQGGLAYDSPWYQATFGGSSATATPTNTPTIAPTATATPPPATNTPTPLPTATLPSSPTATSGPGGCSQNSNWLYVMDGAALNVGSDLKFEHGNVALTDLIPASAGNHIGTPTKPLVYIIDNVSGSYTGGQTNFNIYLDANTTPAMGTQAQIEYDFDGDGSYDRQETYNYFASDPVSGWELYTQTSFGGLATANGSFTNLNDGTIRLQLWKAIGGNSATITIRTSASASDGQQSALQIPFTNLSASCDQPPTSTATPILPTNTPSPTPVGPTATPTATPVSPTATPGSAICNQIPNAANALPGVGCYTTQLPAGEQSITYWPAVDDASTYSPATAKVTSNYSGPYQTNDWWSSLIWDWNQGASSTPPREPYSQNMHPHPLSMQAEPDGLRLAYAREVIQTASEMNYILAGDGAEHLHITVDGLNSPQTSVDSYSDWVVTAAWQGSTNGMQATFGHGLPYVYFTKTGSGNFKVQFVAGPVNVTNNGAVFAFTASNNVGSRYALFGPAGSTWNWTPGSLEAELIAPAGKNYLSVAALPTLDDSRLDFFRRHAYNFVVNTEANWGYNQATQTVNTTFNVTTEAKESGGDLSPLPLFALYRHQWHNLGASNPAFTGDSYTTARGEMKLIEGNSFDTSMTFNGVLPSLPNLGTYDVNTLRGYISDIYTPDHNYHLDAGDPDAGPHETYWEGKNLNRIAQLIHLADQQGMLTERDSFLIFLKATLTDWFDGQYPHVFYYDNQWSTMQGYPTGFGADNQLNDHHFHWSYFIMAAATVAQYDPAWAAQYEGSIELLIRDVANWERTDTQFPYLRYFDVYAGHNWAAGHQAFGAGNNQESSSEAINFSTGLILWGAALGRDDIRDLGVYLYTTEVQAIEQYWFDVDDVVFPAQYPFETVGILWGHGQAHATWWTANPEEIHGINMLPLTGGSLYLGRRTDEVNRNISSLYSEGGRLGYWQDILWEYEALANPASALSRFNANLNYPAMGGQESGETVAHTYHWLHNLNALGQLSTAITANTSTYAVFNKSGAITCVAYNPTTNPLTVSFSNGANLLVQPRSLESTALGGCN